MERAFVLLCTLVGCLVAASCSSGPERAVRTDSGVAVAGQLGVFELQVGDCLDLDESDATAGEFVDLAAVPCDQPHRQEVFHLGTVEGFEVYPGPSELASSADGACLGAFEDYVGTAYLDSAIRFTYLYPSLDSWEEADREIVCLLTHPAPRSEPVGSEEAVANASDTDG